MTWASFGSFLSDVVQSLSRPSERDRGDQPQLEAYRKQSVRERAMVVAGRFEADEDRSSDRGKLSNQAVVIRPGRQHGHPSATTPFRSFDQGLGKDIHRSLATSLQHDPTALVAGIQAANP
jgi:hypothetical protein